MATNYPPPGSLEDQDQRVNPAFRDYYEDEYLTGRDS